ncbi:GNAT family N-acetyltransferase [Nakamurella leprariae]|uniref:GNAT family N-acetyltransferase n=1 Tax=Nakamurella leprariae TaxID=2803911 RepID=A0A939C2F4_9ACTN|nr:GNAT family N-acetyltransferase [Nakamurella leprariae]
MGAVRPIEPRDVPAVVAMVHELAEYERLPQECHLTEAQLRASLFATRPAVFGLVADPDGTGPVGYALWFLNYSTWEGVHGIHLEDLYVRPAARGRGLGRDLLTRLAAIAHDRGHARVEWSVLDWNAPSIAFYRSLGAEPMDGWTTFRLSGPALRRTATGSARSTRSPAG